MGRFSNLEFDRNEEEGSSEESRAASQPRDEKYYLARAQDAFREGRYEESLRFYSRCLEFDVRLPEGWFGQVCSLLELDEPREAKVWAEKGLEQFRAHPELTAARGVALARLGEFDGAMAASDAALAERGASAYRWRARGEVLLARRDRNEEFCFAKAMELSARDWVEPMEIGRVYARYRRYASGLRYLEIASERHASSAHLWETLGRCQEGLGSVAQARKAYRNALHLEAGRPGAQAGWVRVSRSGWVDAFLARVRGWIRR